MRLTLTALLMAACALAPAAENLLPSGDFEGDFGETGVAQGWLDNSSWADLDVQYARETDNPHSGRACQKITCSRLAMGAVQMIPQAWVPLKLGQVYRVRVWLRGDVGAVAVQLRQAPSPYRVYVEEALEVGLDWRQVEYLWTSRVDDPEGRFMLRFTRTGTLWVDDVSVEVLTPEEAAPLAPPPRPGNLLHNGDFDLDLANWMLGHGCDYWAEAMATLDTDGDGRCLRLEVPEGVGTTLASDVVEVTPGRPLRLSCRLRADRPVGLTVACDSVGRKIEASQEWQTFEAHGTAGFGPQPTDYVILVVSGPATLWLDDVQLRQDGIGAAQEPLRGARERVTAAIIADRHPMSLYHDGEPATLRLLSSVPEGRPAVELTWQVQDFWGRVVKAGRSMPAAGRQEESIACAGLPRGWYRAAVSWRDDEHEYRNESAFALLPPADRHGDAGDSPFGAHFAVDPSGIRLAKAVGVRRLRLHPPNHTKWRVVEPQKGDWRWRDEPIRIAREAGFEVCGSLDRCPTWASSAPESTPDGGFYTGTGAWVPRDWREWETYVAETVRRYRERIQVWEVWNEGNLTDWLVPREGHTRAAAYVEMLAHTYPIVKREDPGATVIAGVVAGRMNPSHSAQSFTADVIRLGGLHLMDVFSFHDYIAWPVDEGDWTVADAMAWLRERMREAGRELPIINSEGGFSSPASCLSYRPSELGAVPADSMARWMVRQYVAQLAVGVRQFFFYNFFLDGSPRARQWQGFVEGDAQPRPNVPAYATMTWLLDGAQFLRTDRPDEKVWVHHFRTPRGPLAVTWARTGTQAEVEFPGAVEAWDLMGAPVEVKGAGAPVLRVTDAPLYVLLRE